MRQSKLISSTYSLNDSDQVFFLCTFKTESTIDNKWQNSKLHHPDTQYSPMFLLLVECSCKILMKCNFLCHNLQITYRVIQHEVFNANATGRQQ